MSLDVYPDSSTLSLLIKSTVLMISLDVYADPPSLTLWKKSTMLMISLDFQIPLSLAFNKIKFDNFVWFLCRFTSLSLL